MRQYLAIICSVLLLSTISCRRSDTEFVTVALPEKLSTLDTLTTTGNDSAAERVRNLMFNSLVKKDANFDYVGELASKIDISGDGTTLTFTLRDNVKFHNGKDFTSADVKYTFDKLIESKSFKAGAFFDTVPDTDADSATPANSSNSNTAAAPAKARTKQVGHVVSLELPDPKTAVFKVSRPALANQLLSNLVAIPIIPEGTFDQQKSQPVGSGPFRFVSFDASQNMVEFAAFPEYWDGPTKIAKLRVKTVTDASAMQAELQTGGVDIAPVPSNLPPDSLRSLGELDNLKVEQFEGSNIQYLGLNTQSAPLDKLKVRQAIGYAIDREKIIKELLLGQAKIGSSILPTGSWAYSPGVQYSFDPEKSRQLLKESGYNNEPLKFKYSTGNAAYNQYAQAIQNSLIEVGLNVQIETVSPETLRDQLAKGQFQLNTGVWIGGNQDPIFFKDLFTTGRIPGENANCCNRARYSNQEVDKIIDDAINATDRAKAKELYMKAWDIVSDELPLFPLWYPANMVVSNKRIGNIKISPSGDWSFIKDITVNN